MMKDTSRMHSGLIAQITSKGGLGQSKRKVLGSIEGSPTHLICVHPSTRVFDTFSLLFQCLEKLDLCGVQISRKPSTHPLTIFSAVTMNKTPVGAAQKLFDHKV